MAKEAIRNCNSRSENGPPQADKLFDQHHEERPERSEGKLFDHQ